MTTELPKVLNDGYRRFLREKHAPQRGRFIQLAELGQAPTAMVDLAKPSHKFGVANLKIRLAAHQLDVKVTPERSQYAVRQTVKTRVQVTQAGQPAAGADMAFAAVDESLLALLENDSWKVLESMFPPRAFSVVRSNPKK